MTRYKCMDCGEEFEHKINCVNHHLHKKHEKFDLMETDIELNIKTPKK